MSAHIASQHLLGGALPQTSQAAAFSILEEEAGADVDEPPDNRQPKSASTNSGGRSLFTKETIRRPSFLQSRSLLTLALKNDNHDDEDEDEDDEEDDEDENEDDEDENENENENENDEDGTYQCQRSLSMSSVTDLTSDTGLTSPSRANTPSPTPPEMVHAVPGRRVSIALSDIGHKKRISFACSAVPPSNEPKRRGISFALPTPPHRPTIAVQEPPRRRTCITFACGNEKKSQRNRCASPPPPAPVSPSVQAATGLPVEVPSGDPASSSTINASSYSRVPIVSPPNAILRKVAPLPTGPKKFQIDESAVKTKEPVYFHTFAGNLAGQEDWVREAKTPVGKKLTINDTLMKENAIRRLAKEVEDEEAAEEEEDDMDDDEAEDDMDVDDYDDDECAIEDDSEASDDEYDSDGYHTDEETGFADSDDEDDDLHLWVLTGSTPVPKSLPIDSTIDPIFKHAESEKLKSPKLPDCSDFVCGTFDEDRIMENDYLSCMEQRRQKKLHVIPQDIDPSFPASDPEDETEDFLEALISSSGEMQSEHSDSVADRDRSGRRKSKAKAHSPPPKGRAKSPAPRRMFSPPPKTRAKSPAPRCMFSPPAKAGRLFERPSSKARARSPAVSPTTTTATTSTGGGDLLFHRATTTKFALAPPRTQGFPAQHAKSVPRANAACLLSKARKHRSTAATMAAATTSKKHVRGAIDIIKGLERKREKRKEKLYQEYCNRARKGHKEEQKMQPGEGASKMKAIGLLQSGRNLSQVKMQLQKPLVPHQPEQEQGDNYMISV